MGSRHPVVVSKTHLGIVVVIAVVVVFLGR